MAMSIFFSPTEQTLGKGLGLTVTAAVHVLLVLLLLPGRVHTPPQNQALLTARIISEAPLDSPEQIPIQSPPQFKTQKLTLPAPEIVVASEPSASTAPTREIHSAPSHAAPSEQTADSVPRFNADYLNNPAPVYPRVSRRLREVGVVTLRVYVAPNGAPASIELEQSSGFARLDESAMEAVRQWQFSPAKSAGVAVAAWVIVPVEFSLNT